MAKLKILKKIIITIIIFSIIFLFTGCGKKQSDDEIKMEKADQEIEFLDKKFISVMNLLNNISFTRYEVVSEEIKQENKESQSGSSKSDGSGNSSSGGGSDSNSSSESSSNSGSSSDSSSEDDSKNNEEENKNFKLTEDNILSLDSNSDIKWTSIKSDIESLYSIWATISIDLNSLKVKQEDISQFNILLDNLAKSAKDENKQEALTNLSNLYNLLPIYLKTYSNDNVKINVISTKAHLLTAYSILDTGDWNKIAEEIGRANNEFQNITNNSEIDSNKQLNVKRADLLLKEAQTGVEREDKEIFLLKYKNAIQELNML